MVDVFRPPAAVLAVAREAIAKGVGVLWFQPGTHTDEAAGLAPSLFGYLGSTLPEGATPATQADAFASLLDYLEVSQVVLFGYSAGGPSAIQFALRHRDRTTVLVLMASAPPGKDGAPPKFIARTMLGSDAFFWLLRRLVPTQLGRLMGVPAGLRPTPEQRMTVADSEEGPFPIAPRKEGVLFDLYVSNPAVQDMPWS